jgi:MFS family permease
VRAYWRLLVDRADYRRLFGARLVSLFGDWLNLMAILTLLREQGADDASSFGAALILKTLPALVVAPLAGVLADRMSRRRILIGTDVLRGGIVACILLQSIWPSVPMLYALIVAQTAVGAFFEPARSALLPNLLSPAEIVRANALSGAAWSTMLALGSAAGGLLTAWLGWRVAIGLDVLTYGVSLVLLLRLREPDWAPAQTTVRQAFGTLVEGVRYLRQRPHIRKLALAKFGWSVAGSTTLVLTLLGEGPFRVAAAPVLGVTVLFVARGTGTGIGPFLGRWLTGEDPQRMERLIGWSYVLGAVGYAVAATMPSLWLAAAFVVLAHFGGATVWVFSTARLQQLVPNELRGRVFAADQGAFMLMAAGSTLVFGLASDRVGLSPQALTACIGGVLLLPAMWWFVRKTQAG